MIRFDNFRLQYAWKKIGYGSVKFYNLSEGVVGYVGLRSKCFETHPSIYSVIIITEIDERNIICQKLKN